MSTSDAEALLRRLEGDGEFAARLQSCVGHPETTHRLAAEAGYSFTREEMLGALDSLYGVEVTPEQLEQVAAETATLLTLGSALTTPLAGSAVMGAAAA